MMAQRQKTWAKTTLALAFLLALAPARALYAQETTKPAAETATQQEQASDKAQGERETRAGGEADAIRHAPAVKYIARHTGLTDDQAYWLCIGLNFAVIFFFIAQLLRKKLPGYFKGRTSTIQKGIEEARKMSDDARLRLAEVENRLSRLDADIAAMRREAEENAKAEEGRIVAAGEEERRRIVASTEQEIAMAANAARRELKSYAAELAVDLAEKKIRVGKETDEALVHKFTIELGKGGN